MLKLFLVKRRVEGSTYPTLAATLVVETLFDAFVGIALLAVGDPPRRASEPRRARRTPEHRLALAVRASRASPRSARSCSESSSACCSSSRRAGCARSGSACAQGFAIVRAAAGDYLRRVVTWQALSWVFRLASVYWMLRAFHLPVSIHNALLVQLAQSLSTLLPITPGGAGTEQGLLLYLFRGSAARTRAALVQRRHAHRDRRDQRRARADRAGVADAVAAVRRREARPRSAQATQSAPR